MAAARIKTAEEHIAAIVASEKVTKSNAQKRKAEQAEFKRKQKQLEDTRDMRDDLMSAVRNSGMSFETIHSHCGPHPSTLRSWDEKRVDAPRMGKMRATGKIIGLKLAWVPDGDNDA